MHAKSNHSISTWLSATLWTSLVAQRVKCLPTMWETWIRSLGWEDPLEKEMATHSSTLAWKIPRTGEPGGLPSLGSHRVRHGWSDLAAAAAAAAPYPLIVSNIIISEWVKSLSHVRLFASPWTITCQAPPSMGFSWQDYWSGLPFASPKDLTYPETKAGSPAL